MIRRLVASLACIALAVSPASADLIVEVYHGKRPVEAPPIMASLRRIFEDGLHVKWTSDLVHQQIRYLPEPGISDPSLTVNDLFDRLELGKRESIRVLPDGQINFKGGELALTEALDTVRRNAALVMVDANARSRLTRAAVALAISKIRLRDQVGADEVLADLARSLGGAPLAGQSPEIEKHYNRVNTGLAKLLPGKLLIVVNDPDALIFVNEGGLGRGGTFGADLIPGPYRIVILSRGESRRYEVQVEPGKETKLDLDWQIETALRVSAEWVGLELPSQPSQERLEQIARRLYDRTRSEKAPTGERVILLGIEQSCGHTVLSGLHFPDSPRVQVGRVVLGERNDQERILALARFVVQNVVTIKLDRGGDEIGFVVGAAKPWCAETPSPSVARATPSDVSLRLATPLVIGGLVVLAGGMTWHHFAAANPSDPGAALTLGNRRVQSLVVGGVGGYLVGAGVAAWVRQRYSNGVLATMTLAVGVGTVIGGTILFASDEDSTGKTLYYQDSAKPGLMVGAAGLGLIGAAYILTRGGGSARAPSVSLSPDHLGLGWGRAF